MGAYFFEQLDNWNFGFIAPALAQSWNLQMTDIATIVFWYFVAMTTGGFMGGIISDFIGRRKTFLGAILVFSIASMVTGFTDNFVVFTIFRALTGMFTKRYIVRTLLLMFLFITITPAGFLFTTWTTQLLKMKGFSVADSLTATTIISIGVPVGCFLAFLISDLGGRKIRS